jgi:DNA polymerase (family 10)
VSRNAEVAALLEEMASRLEADSVDYKPRAYRRAAEQVRGHAVDVETVYEHGGTDALQEIDRVGEAIASKIADYLETGDIDAVEEMRAEMPADIDALTAVEGVGPKSVRKLYDALGIEDLDDLEAAAGAGEIREVEGFGATTEENIAESIPFARESHERELLGEVRPLADRLLDHLRGREAVERADVAGSIRRWRATIGDVDVLVASDDPEAAVDAFTGWPAATDVIEAGTGKASVRVEDVRVDLRVVTPAEFGAALQYFTGSRDHNIALRNRAIAMDVKLNEYGAFDVSGVEDPDADRRAGERVAGETEDGMYAAVGLPWMPPELRENRGELDAAEADELPDLLAVEDVRGDLHTHTAWSDGEPTVAEMVAGAAEFGHDYLAITDHATGPGMVGGVGLTDAELREQLAEVREVAADADIEVFAGVEANVAADGSVSVDDDMLADLDCVVASPHAALDGDGTDRLVAAVEHPEVDVLGHPTGRLLNRRPGLDVDADRLARAAAEHGTALEVNADPRRLDLGGGLVKRAVEAGATVAVNTDAHRPSALGKVRYGVHTARRGWAEAADMLNTRDAEGVRAFLES